MSSNAEAPIRPSIGTDVTSERDDGVMSGDYDDLLAQLEDISEKLGDRIMTLLREALESGADGRPAEEKLLSRARSAVDKAAALLGRVEN